MPKALPRNLRGETVSWGKFPNTIRNPEHSGQLAPFCSTDPFHTTLEIHLSEHFRKYRVIQISSLLSTATFSHMLLPVGRTSATVQCSTRPLTLCPSALEEPPSPRQALRVQ
jgi:hypothetical protein